MSSYDFESLLPIGSIKYNYLSNVKYLINETPINDRNIQSKAQSSSIYTISADQTI